MTKQKLPSIAKVKKSLYNDWALRVKQRDGWKCLLCGATDNLTAHHWYVCDHNAHAARYALANGATLCYACHIRGIHQRADWQSVNGLYLRLLDTGAIGVSDPTAINELSKIELTHKHLPVAVRPRLHQCGDEDVTATLEAQLAITNAELNFQKGAKRDE